ncbi:MAG: pitrilysin family protein, partial [Bacteroidota bacterium]
MTPSRRTLTHALVSALAIFCCNLSAAQTSEVKMIVLDTPAELVQVRIMVRAGSAFDPVGLEGLSNLTAQLILEGSYGDPKAPVTKEKLAEFVRQWGSAAKPSVAVEKETATFSMSVPLDVLPQYVDRVLHPLFTQPLFAQEELDRVRLEFLEDIGSTLRLENTELLGLYGLDNFLHHGTSYGHAPIGTVQGLKAVKRGDILAFYKTYYAPESLIVGLNTMDDDVVRLVQQALETVGGNTEVGMLEKQIPEPPHPIDGRYLTIVIQPGTIASGIHAGFPLLLTRSHPDYWSLYVANIFFGTHRDGFGRLYRDIRQTRGYNYGDYSYIEWFNDRPFYLFPPPNTPRGHQYFSLWVRPVAHQYVHHILKAITWELENFIREGMTPEECRLAKNKAKVLYLNLAETSSRLLGYKLDDEFYGMSEHGYLDEYLQAIDRLTPGEINTAIRKYLQTENLKYVIVTNEEWANRLKKDIAENRNARGKNFKEYNIDFTVSNGDTLWQFPKNKMEVVQMDKVWEIYWLDIPSENIEVARSSQLFENR